VLPPDSWNDTVEQFAAGFARVAGMYGQTPTLGRLYGVLFLSAEPLTLDALCEAVGAAKSTVSVAIRKLETAKLVRRHWKKGDRRDYYEAVADPQRLVSDWIRTFLTPELDAWLEVQGLARASLESPPEDAPPEEQLAALRARLDAWDTFGLQVMQMLAPLLAGPASSSFAELAARAAAEGDPE